jgi:hypothetical protein
MADDRFDDADKRMSERVQNQQLRNQGTRDADSGMGARVFKRGIKARQNQYKRQTRRGGSR